MPALPADIPKDATIWMLLTDKKPAGQDAVWTTPDGVVHEFFQFNDRGRGPKTYSTYRLDSKGIVTFEETTGVDYMKNPVNESFSVTVGNAKWKNSSEDGQQPNAAGRFYAGLSGGPASWLSLAAGAAEERRKAVAAPRWRGHAERTEDCSGRSRRKESERHALPDRRPRLQPNVSCGSTTTTTPSPLSRAGPA